MAGEIKLAGLDFGTTTSSAVIASARLSQNAVTTKTQITGVKEVFRSQMTFTPLVDGRLDEAALTRQVENWFSEAGVDSAELFGGGALLTGLTAQQSNATVIVRTIRRQLKNALIATADDPCLESWLAFMGNCATLSRANPDIPIVNLDIGGGTTNLALGLKGRVLRTGCLYVGARHIEVIPGSYQIRRLSRYATQLLAELNITKGVGDCLTEAEVEAVLAFYMALLVAAVEQRSNAAELTSRVGRLHEAVPLQLPREISSDQLVICVSGGVGELVYAHLRGEPWPAQSRYGDLGIALAKKLVASPWIDVIRQFDPQSAGRATVYGLLRYNTEVSGNTLFLPNPDCLPLTDVPILGAIAANSTDADLHSLTRLLMSAADGACVRIELVNNDAEAIKSFARRISRILMACDFPAEQPLVLLVKENVGKVLGSYVTEWGALPLNLVVIDEVVAPEAQYVRIGRPHTQVVPVSFYGLNESAD